MKWIFNYCLCFLLFTANTAWAKIVVDIYSLQQPQQLLGTITAENNAYGLLLMPDLKGLSPGLHGFHVHQSPSCANAGMAAGGHLDPQHHDKHLGPYNDQGHLGDLPALYVDADGKAQHPLLAPRLKEKDLIGHSLMIHAGGDNYSDSPEKLGGGGARIACGVIANNEG